MKQLQTLIKQGELIAATERAMQLLRDDPANADVFVEAVRYRRAGR